MIVTEFDSAGQPVTSWVPDEPDSEIGTNLAVASSPLHPRFRPGDRVTLPCGKCAGKVLKLLGSGSIYTEHVPWRCLVRLDFLNAETWLDEQYLSPADAPQ